MVAAWRGLEARWQLLVCSFRYFSLLVALSLSVTKFWLALGAVLFVYQVEVNVLVPVVLGKEMRINPVMILFFTIATRLLA